MHLAYKCGDSDRPLNIVILSDGMTEHRESTELLQLIRQRPSRATVFAVGVGNEVNRPLLSQMADDAGGLAAFVSRGDDFERQAKSFRRKLIRPAAENLRLEIDGVEVHDVVPRQLPSLYHGLPIRVVGRYRGDSSFHITLSGEVRGKPMSIEDTLVADNQNQPEIERIWAFTRIKELLREADLAGSRSAVKDEIVSLGTGYSIASEYTSFLVLENNDEYKRWRIDRRNVQRLGRDRQSRDSLRLRLNSLKADSLARVGPIEAPRRVPSSVSINTPASTTSPTTKITPEPSSGVLLLLSLWPLLHLARKRRK